jgi:transcriptional regulator with XRE-family HTH domain
MERKRHSWTQRALTLQAEEELKAMGRNIKIARRRRRIGVYELADRIGVNPRVISKIEKGDPTVSLGALIQVLDLLGMLKGLNAFLAPERDYRAAHMEARNALGRPSQRVFSESELDF